MCSTTQLIADLKARRRALGWAIEEVADRAGMAGQLLTDWERGIGAPRLDEIDTWATALELKLALIAAQDQLRQGLVIDWQKRCVTVDGSPVRLTPMEWKALERLAWNPGELVTHEALFRHLYGQDRSDRAQSTAVRVLITKLRRLLPLRIDARWGRGYVISGIASSLGRSPCEGAAAEAERTASAPAPAPMPRPVKIERQPEAPKPNAPPCPAPAMTRKVIDLATRAPRPSAPLPPQLGMRRTEELGVIERFLAERGVTRCPDVATIQHSPLPTLVWDKIKRKWVRPSLNQAS